MSNVTSTDSPQHDYAEYYKELDELVAGGWDAVLERFERVSQLILVVAANIHKHRKTAMNPPELVKIGVFELSIGLHVSDVVQLIGGYHPQLRSVLSQRENIYVSPFKFVRDTFPPNEISSGYIKSLDLAVELAVDGVAILAERAGMPSPTFEQILHLYIELARIGNVQAVLYTAASVELSVGAIGEDDLFGVGNQMSKAVNQIIPPRCVPDIGRITLPNSPSIDHIVAANLLSRYVMKQAEICFEFAKDPTFDAANTNSLNHGTICVGAYPHHEPESLCFDVRDGVSDGLISQLVVEHAESLGVPMDFSEPILSFVSGNDTEKYRYEADMVNALFRMCDSPTLAMCATGLFLDDRFKTSARYKEWANNRYQKKLEQLPGYLENAPKPQPQSAVFLDLCERVKNDPALVSRPNSDSG